MKLTTEQEMELIEEYKKELICPKCEGYLVNKDYKINKRNLILVVIASLCAFALGVFMRSGL